ncbi:hypothetical protein Tsubulata_032890, partial [Turnera subulata]
GLTRYYKKIEVVKREGKKTPAQFGIGIQFLGTEKKETWRMEEILRPKLVEFLIHSAHQLQITPIVKYTALSLFADRFLPSLPRKALDYEIGAGNIAFVFLQDLLFQLKAIANVGELVNFEACMDIMDLLYEKEDTSLLYASPLSLAASTLARFLISLHAIYVPCFCCFYH